MTATTPDRSKEGVALAAALALACLGLVPPVAAAGLRVAVVSDLNEGYGSTRYGPAVHRAIERIVAIRPDLVLCAGDMVAGQRRRPALTRPELEAMWEGFHAAVSAPLLAAGLPLAVTPGNHDASGYVGFALEREVYREQWAARVPRLEILDREAYPFRYAFAAGGALFVSLDVTTTGALARGQKTWLRELLRGRGSGFRWRIAFSHLPVWAFTQGREQDISADRELEEILREGRVDLYLNGHHHAFYPAVKDGLRHVSQACLGAGPRALLGTQKRSVRGFTLLDLRDDGTITVSALVEPDFTHVLDLRSLPERIDAPGGPLVREDLVPGPPIRNP